MCIRDRAHLAMQILLLWGCSPSVGQELKCVPAFPLPKFHYVQSHLVLSKLELERARTKTSVTESAWLKAEELH